MNFKIKILLIKMTDFLKEDCSILFENKYKKPIYAEFKFSINLLEDENYIWLKNSYFYKNLDSDSQELLDIPFCSENCQDIFLYIKVLDFWGIDLPPESFFNLIFNNKLEAYMILKNMQNSKFYDFLKDILQSDDINRDFAMLAFKHILPDILLYSWNKYEWSSTMANIVVENKNFDLFLILFNSEFASFFDINVLAEKGCTDFLKHLHENGTIFDNEVLYYSALSGNVECLKYIHSIQKTLDERTFSGAVYSKSIDCIKYLHENNCPWDRDIDLPYALFTIIKKNHDPIECLKFLYENGYLFFKGILKRIVECGSIKCLEYLFDKVPIEYDLHDIAAEKEHFECLKFLHEKGFRFTKITKYLARNNKEMLNYIEDVIQKQNSEVLDLL
uniref:Ankyrin repeat protein n=1 Tax=viral metagenome TaxID=1070528 RepID=A0A6C0AER6_9ZZZZ